MTSSYTPQLVECPGCHRNITPCSNTNQKLGKNKLGKSARQITQEISYSDVRLDCFAILGNDPFAKSLPLEVPCCDILRTSAGACQSSGNIMAPLIRSLILEGRPTNTVLCERALYARIRRWYSYYIILVN